jgi:alpha-ketoglutarate-dependent taurine dioxygenase
MPKVATEKLAGAFGKPAAVSGLTLVQDLRPRPLSETPENIYSGNFGFGEFPLHTDMAHWAIPPRYLMLRCVAGDPSVTTFLADSQGVVRHFGEARMAGCSLKPRKPVEGRFHLLSAYQPRPPLGPLFRWDELFLKAATKTSEVICEHVRNHMSGLEKQAICLHKAGDTVIIDNWRMLHGRSAVSSDVSDRHIQRIYLSELH